MRFTANTSTGLHGLLMQVLFESQRDFRIRLTAPVNL
jgi:hypothetical protein